MPPPRQSPLDARSRDQAVAPGAWRSPWAMEDDPPPRRRRVLPPEPGPKVVAPPLIVPHKSIEEVKTRAEPLPRVSALPAPVPTVAEPTPAVVRSAAAPRRELTHAEKMHQEIARLRAINGRQRMTKLLMLAVAVFTFTMISWVYLSDEALPSDADLVPMAVPVSADVPPPRAPGRLRLALDTAVTVDVSPASPVEVWRWDTPTLAKTVQANAQALDNLRDLLSEADWQSLHPIWLGEDLGSHPNWEALGRAKVAAAFYFARTGDDRAALQTAIDLAVLARQLQTLMGWPTCYARGLELHQRACECLAEMLRTTRASPHELALQQNAFEQTSPSDALLQEALNYFYRYERRVIVGPDPTLRDVNWVAAVPKARHARLFFKPNATLRTFVAGFRSLRNEVMKTPYARVPSLMPLVGAVGSPVAIIGSPNVTGARVANERLWAYAQLVERQGLQSARHTLVLTLFGLRRFAAENGRFPLALNELIPGCFRELPLDPYSGKPIIFRADRALIYSVGVDAADNGGHLTSVPLGDMLEPTLSAK